MRGDGVGGAQGEAEGSGARPGSAGPVWVVAAGETCGRWTLHLAQHGVDAWPLPWGTSVRLLDPARLADALARAPDLLLLTSARAARCLPEGSVRDLEAACVGEGTARAARSAGLDVRHVGSGGALDLARRIARERPAGRVLFLRGEEAREEAAALLAQEGWTVEPLVVYAVRPHEGFDALVARAPEPAASVVGSPRGAEALAGALERTRRGDLCARPAVAAGATTGARLAALGFARVAHPERPGVEGILHLLEGLLGRS